MLFIVIWKKIKANFAPVYKPLYPMSRGAFIPFIMAGDPSLEITERAILELDALGADVIEIGVPYSDPLADGPTIQKAHVDGLNTKTTLDKVFSMISKISPRLQSSLVMFQYYNTILHRGLSQYCRQAKEAGVSGVLVPDLCVEESLAMCLACKDSKLEMIQLITPTTNEQRMRRIVDVAEGFLYLVSVTGVTGSRTSNNSEVKSMLATLSKIKRKTQRIAVGFGVSTPQQASELRGWGADGVIVGSALVKLLNGVKSDQDFAAFAELAKNLRNAI